MNAYWKQFSPVEIMQMHGLDLDHEEVDKENEESEYVSDFDYVCKFCKAKGCNFCLMLEW